MRPPLLTPNNGLGRTGVRPPVTIEVDHCIVARLRIEAARRERTVKSLILELLDTIANDKLVDAVLDDEAEPPRA